MEGISDALRYRDLWMGILGMALSCWFQFGTCIFDLAKSIEKEPFKMIDLIFPGIAFLASILSSAWLGLVWYKKCKTKNQTIDNLIQEIKDEHHPEFYLIETKKTPVPASDRPVE
jgi:hypothetical protein